MTLEEATRAALAAAEAEPVDCRCRNLIPAPSDLRAQAVRSQHAADAETPQVCVIVTCTLLPPPKERLYVVSITLQDYSRPPARIVDQVRQIVFPDGGSGPAIYTTGGTPHQGVSFSGCPAKPRCPRAARGEPDA